MTWRYTNIRQGDIQAERLAAERKAKKGAEEGKKLTIFLCLNRFASTNEHEFEIIFMCVCSGAKKGTKVSFFCEQLHEHE